MDKLISFMKNVKHISQFAKNRDFGPLFGFGGSFSGLACEKDPNFTIIPYFKNFVKHFLKKFKKKYFPKIQKLFFDFY